MDTSVIIFRFLLTFVFSLLFGIERQRAHKPTGFATFNFVALGSCGLAIASIILFPEESSSLMAGVVTGIGFLGAGALIRTTDRVFGFTTAASIWVFAILGLVIGAGEYLLGTIIYGIVWLVIFFDMYFEKRGIGSYQRRMIVMTNKIINEHEIRDHLSIGKRKPKLINMYVDKSMNRLTLTYLIEGTKEDINTIPKKIFKEKWLESLRLE